MLSIVALLATSMTQWTHVMAQQSQDVFAVNAYWATHPSFAPYDYFETTMTIPPVPAQEWRTLFLWPGLQPLQGGANFLPIDNGALQPVLTWGPSCAPNPNNLNERDGWWISGQYVNTLGMLEGYRGCFGGERMAVSPGDSIRSVMEIIPGTTVWKQTITNRNNGRAVTFEKDMRGQAQAWAEFIMEIPGGWHGNVPSWEVTNIILRTSGNASVPEFCRYDQKVLALPGASLSCAPPIKNGNMCVISYCAFNKASGTNPTTATTTTSTTTSSMLSSSRTSTSSTTSSSITSTASSTSSIVASAITTLSSSITSATITSSTTAFSSATSSNLFQGISPLSSLSSSSSVLPPVPTTLSNQVSPTLILSLGPLPSTSSSQNPIPISSMVMPSMPMQSIMPILTTSTTETVSQPSSTVSETSTTYPTLPPLPTMSFISFHFGTTTVSGSASGSPWGTVTNTPNTSVSAAIPIGTRWILLTTQIMGTILFGALTVLIF